MLNSSQSKLLDSPCQLESIDCRMAYQEGSALGLHGTEQLLWALNNPQFLLEQSVMQSKDLSDGSLHFKTIDMTYLKT